jgi:predicted nucleic acid-binding protein
VLDTNVLVHLVRRKAAGKHIDQTYALSQRPDRPLCSVISVGEALHLAARNNWGDDKRDALRQLFSDLVIVQLGARGVAEKYAALGVHAERLGRRLEQNDLWIAATAAATNAVLLTTDAGFDVLHPGQLERIYIDPTTLPRDR